jgi:hypothetical protein
MSTALTGQGAGAAGQGDGTPAGAGGTGNQSQQSQPTPDWRTSLPEELRSEKVFESIKGKDWAEAGPVLAKNYLNAQKLVGAEKLVLPTKDSTPEQVAEFRKKLGVPDKADEYGIALPEGMKEEQLNKESLDTWRQRLHAQGIPKAAAEAIIKDYLADTKGMMDAQTKAQEEQAKAWQQELRQKFGVNYDKSINLARYALEEFADPKLTEWLESTGAGNNPTVVEFFSKVGAAMSEDRPRTGVGGVEGGEPRSKAQAQAAINEFHRNEAKQKALWDANHPQHDAVVKERDKLFQIAYADEDEK